MGDPLDAPATADGDVPLDVTVRGVQEQAAEVRALARERLVWARAVQAKAWEVREQVAASSRRAEIACAHALGVYLAACEAWSRTHEVRMLSDVASERARALRTPQMRDMGLDARRIQAGGADVSY